MRAGQPVFRIDPGPDVEWYDVDYPDVADLRRQLYPARDHYHVVAASVTDPAWLADIPADRPMLMIGEGLTMYLTEDDGIALLRRVVDHFPSGELQFDAFNRLGIKSQWTNAVVRRSGATLHWGIDGPDDILEAVPGQRLLAWVSAVRLATPSTDVPWYYRLMAEGDDAGAGAALHGAVPPLRVLSTHTEHRLSPSPVAEGGRPRPPPTTVGPHDLGSARISGPPNATAKFRCASGRLISTISMSGPDGILSCLPGVKSVPAKASRATCSAAWPARGYGGDQ